MSGEKCGTVTVDWNALKADAERGTSGEGARRRQRAERARLRRERLARRERRLMEEAVAELGRARALFDAAAARREQLMGAFAGLHLPELPVVSSDTPASLQEVRAAGATLRQVGSDFQAAMDRALMRHHQQAAATASAEQVRQWLASFAGHPGRTSAGVIAALEPDRIFVGDARQRARVGIIVERAREAIESSGLGDDDHLPGTVLSALDRIVDAGTVERAQSALEDLHDAVATERERRREAAEARERLESAEQRQAVADTVMLALEDLGYEVSGIEDTAFVNEGVLYAMSDEFPEHVLRFQLAADGTELRSAPLRVEQDAQASGAADARLRSEHDARVDHAWCSEHGIVRLRGLLARRGVKVAFRAIRPPGEEALSAVPVEALPKALRRRREAMRTPLRQRRHQPDQ